MRGSRVLVTGGAGFIGSHLCRRLAGIYESVAILDDLSTSMACSLAGIPSDKVTLKIGSILDMDILRLVMKDVDIVFHLAALPSVSRSVKYPVLTHMVNANGTLNVLLIAVASGVKRVVYTSSSSVYGDALKLPKREDMLPLPRSPYAASKLAGESYCQAFERTYGISTICLRYFNVYGPGQNPESEYAAVIPRFMSCLKDGRSPIIYGDGNQTRDFTYVDDVVDATILAAESDATGVFNIGCGEKHSINEVVTLLERISGKKMSPRYEPERQGDVRDSLADIKRATRFLNYKPEYCLEDGLKRMVNIG